MSQIVPVTAVTRLWVERPDSRGSIPGWWGNFYLTVNRSTLPPLQWAWAVTNGVKRSERGPNNSSRFNVSFNDVDI